MAASLQLVSEQIFAAAPAMHASRNVDIENEDGDVSRYNCVLKHKMWIQAFRY